MQHQNNAITDFGKCDIQLSFCVLRSTHIALLNQAIQAGMRRMFCLTPETLCLRQRGS